MQSTTFLVLMTSCLGILVTAGNKEMNQVHSRAERSPHLLLDVNGRDGPATTDEYRNYLALKAKNQDSDITSARFDGFVQKQDATEKQAAEDERQIVLLNPGTEEILSNTDEGLGGPVVSKRFNEFVGKRNSLIDDKAVASSEEDNVPDSFNTNGVLVNLPKLSPERQESEIFDQGNVENDRALINLMRGLHNEGLSKRQYEFVGKRSYDFVGKKRYDFLEKRHPYDFIGKRIDFVDKRKPYDFLGKKSYDFLGKRAPYEFVGKRDHDNEASQSRYKINPLLSARERQMVFLNNNIMPDLSSLDAQELDGTNKRYSEFLGKRKRSTEREDTTLSNSERLTALLQNNGLRKRLSRMLLNQRLVEHYPGFVGK